MRILKYQLHHTQEQTLSLPSVRDVLRLDVQKHTDGSESIQMWLLVDVESEKTPMTIIMLETSNTEVDVDLSQHLGTIFYHGVYHVFKI